MAETGPLPPDQPELPADAELAAHRRIYERDGVTYRAYQIHGPDDGPALADFIVRRDSDGRYGGYIVDLARDGGPETFGPDALRYEAYDDCARLVAPASSLPGALSVFAQPGRGFRWISDRLPDPEIEPGG
jgi:hypothetical protein